MEKWEIEKLERERLVKKPKKRYNAAQLAFMLNSDAMSSYSAYSKAGSEASSPRLRRDSSVESKHSSMSRRGSNLKPSP